MDAARRRSAKRVAAARGLRCPVEDDSGVAVLRPAGVLTLRTAGVVRTALAKSLAAHPVGIAVDMSHLMIEDDRCLRVFAAAARSAAAWPGCRVAISVPDATAARMRHLSINVYISICTTAEDAIASARIPSFGSEVREDYAPRLASVGAARAFAAEACAQWRVPEQPTMIVRLAVTELVGNAVRHAGTAIELVLRLTSRHIHIVVRDEDPRRPRLLGTSGPDESGGRGLLLVDALAAAWGSTPTGDGKVTWASVRHTDA